MAESAYQDFVTQETRIGEMIRQYPSAVEVVAKYGVHCVGCHVSQFESLGDGLRAHGYDEAEVDRIIAEVNGFLAKRNFSSSLFSVSEFAAKKLQEMASRQSLQDWFLRVKVIKGGCAGNTSELDFVTKKNDDDMLIEAFGSRIIVDPSSAKLLEGAVLEYVESLNESGFKVHNPHAKRSCACGTSFMM